MKVQYTLNTFEFSSAWELASGGLGLLDCSWWVHGYLFIVIEKYSDGGSQMASTVSSSLFCLQYNNFECRKMRRCGEEGVILNWSYIIFWCFWLWLCRRLTLRNWDVMNVSGFELLDFLGHLLCNNREQMQYQYSWTCIFVW